MPRTGKRAANFTLAEIDILLTCLEEDSDLLHNKIGGKIKNVSELNQRWDDVGEKVTEVSGFLGEKRTGHDLKRKWTDLKHRARAKVAKITQEAELNGGASFTKLTPLEERILTLMSSDPSQSFAKQVVQYKAPSLRVFSFQNDSNSLDDSESHLNEGEEMSDIEGNESDIVSEIKSTNEAKKRKLSEVFNNSAEKHFILKKSRNSSEEEQLSEMCASQKQMNLELTSIKEILKKCHASIEKLALLKKAELRLKCAKHGIEFDDLFD